MKITPTINIGPQENKFTPFDEVKDNHNHGLIQNSGNDKGLTHKLENMSTLYTSVKNSKYSVGSQGGKLIRQLSKPFKTSGNFIQGGNDFRSSSLKLDYVLGSVLKGIGNVIGGVSGMIGSTVSGIENMGKTAIDSVDSLVHKDKDSSGNSFSLKNIQRSIGLIGANEILAKTMLTNFSVNVPFKECPKGLIQATSSDIPKTILTKGVYNKSKSGGDTETSTGSVLQLRIDSTTKDGLTTLSGDKWSSLKIGVFITEGEPTKVALVFDGTEFNKNRISTVKSDISSFLGMKDSSMVDANKVVEEFVKEYGKENMEIFGHSLGGGLATYAGIKNGVKVTAFNSMGLNLNLRNELGNEKLGNSNVTHINNHNDLLSQIIEGGKYGGGGSQVGIRNVIESDHAIGGSAASQHLMHNLYLSVQDTVVNNILDDFRKQEDIVKNITNNGLQIGELDLDESNIQSNEEKVSFTKGQFTSVIDENILPNEEIDIDEEGENDLTKGQLTSVIDENTLSNEEININGEGDSTKGQLTSVIDENTLSNEELNINGEGDSTKGQLTNVIYENTLLNVESNEGESTSTNDFIDDNTL